MYKTLVARTVLPQLQKRLDLWPNQLRGTRRRSSYTYLIEAEGTGLVKIGKATNVDLRYRQLQRMNAARLEVFGAFEGDVEAYLHSQFSEHRRHGEWFYAPPIKEWFTRMTKISEKPSIT